MNFFPLCTAIVCPTISGMIVERRDQVFRTLRSLRRFISSIFFERCPSTKAPLRVDLAIPVASLPRAPAAPYLLRRRTMKRSVLRFCRVLYPLLGVPQGLTGCRPPEVFPSPPPIG